jgi:hypothetical protein
MKRGELDEDKTSQVALVVATEHYTSRIGPLRYG